MYRTISFEFCNLRTWCSSFFYKYWRLLAMILTLDSSTALYLVRHVTVKFISISNPIGSKLQIAIWKSNFNQSCMSSNRNRASPLAETWLSTYDCRSHDFELSSNWYKVISLATFKWFHWLVWIEVTNEIALYLSRKSFDIYVRVSIRFSSLNGVIHRPFLPPVFPCWQAMPICLR